MKCTSQRAALQGRISSFSQTEPDLGAASQERFSLLADFSSLALVGAGVLRSCCTQRMSEWAPSIRC